MGEFSAEEKEAMKAEAGIAACNFVKDGMKIGIGTGSTVKYTILELGRRIREEGLEIAGIPTSEVTEKLSIEQGIPLVNWTECSALDLVIDGADEFDSNLHLIKGGGGALLREKIVAESSAGMVVVADASKQVEVLGTFPLPIEVNPYGWEQTQRRIQAICSGPVVRRGPEYLTDNGNPILDAHFGPVISTPLRWKRNCVRLQGWLKSVCSQIRLMLLFSRPPVDVRMIRKENARL